MFSLLVSRRVCFFYWARLLVCLRRHLGSCGPACVGKHFFSSMTKETKMWVFSETCSNKNPQICLLLIALCLCHQYVEKLDLCGLVSVTDDSSPDPNLDAARFNVQMTKGNIKFTVSGFVQNHSSCYLACSNSFSLKMYLDISVNFFSFFFCRPQMQNLGNFGRDISTLWLRSVLLSLFTFRHIVFLPLPLTHAHTPGSNMKLCLPADGGTPHPEPAAGSGPHPERDGPKGEGEADKSRTEPESSCCCQTRNACVSLTGVNHF